jgi:hypothetical protein
MNKLTIAAAALAAGLLVQTQGFTRAPIRTNPSARTANHVGTTSVPKNAAHKAPEKRINALPPITPEER